MRWAGQQTAARGAGRGAGSSAPRSAGQGPPPPRPQSPPGWLAAGPAGRGPPYGRGWRGSQASGVSGGGLDGRGVWGCGEGGRGEGRTGRRLRGLGRRAVRVRRGPLHPGTWRRAQGHARYRKCKPGLPLTPTGGGVCPSFPPAVAKEGTNSGPPSLPSLTGHFSGWRKFPVGGALPQSHGRVGSIWTRGILPPPEPCESSSASLPIRWCTCTPTQKLHTLQTNLNTKADGNPRETVLQR